MPPSAAVLIFCAVVCAAVGYPETCWVLVLSAPFVLPPVAWNTWKHGLNASGLAWFAFFYAAIGSMVLGVYAGTAGWLAKVGQLQLSWLSRF